MSRRGPTTHQSLRSSGGHPRGPASDHWDRVYGGRDPDELGWFEAVPSTLDLVVAHAEPDDGVIDVGGGASLLSAALLGRGFSDLTVLDVSPNALSAGRARLGTDAESVRWIEADVTTFEPDRTWRVWHDRAVFHFLVEPADRRAYRRAAEAAVEPGGVVVVATFGPDGPESCAGLPVRRYDVGGLAAEFAPAFDLVSGGPVAPPSRAGDQRPYVAVVLRRHSD